MTSLLFPKDTEEIVRHMMKDATPQEMTLYKQVLKIINLMKGIIKSYSENKLRKIMSISEIKVLFSDFLIEIERGNLVLCGLVQSDNLLDQKYIRSIIGSLKKLVGIQSCF